MTHRSEKPHIPYSDIPASSLRRIRPGFTAFDNPWTQDPNLLDKPWRTRLTTAALLMLSVAFVVAVIAGVVAVLT